MISQITNIQAVPIGNIRPAPAQVVDIKLQKSSASTETSHHYVTEDDASIDDKQHTAKAHNKTVDLKTVKDAAEQVNKVLQQINRDLQFSVDNDTGTSIVKVIDKQSKEVIRQIPSQEVLEMSKALDKLQGLLFRETA